MKDLLFHNIYAIMFYKCEVPLFNYFRKNLVSGFIMEQITDLNYLRLILKVGRIFLIADKDHATDSEIININSLFPGEKKKYVLYFGQLDNEEKTSGSFYLKSENENQKAINYIKTIRTQEIYTYTYNNLYESIEYAGKIQKAILPDFKNLHSYFSEYFIFNRPRDVVSGDFYWAAFVNDLIFVAAGDCTGHGVPGAFMSILGITLLNEIVHVDGHYETDVILNNLRQNIIKSLSQSFEGSDVHDGMDIALCAFRSEYDILEFSGAFNPAIIIRDNEFIEIQANRMPVGIYIKDHIDFSKEYFDLKKNDQIYMFSDGYSDQIGGVNSKKLRKKRFYDLLYENRKLTLNEQYIKLEKFMEKWKGSNEQMDDMLIVGLKI